MAILRQLKNFGVFARVDSARSAVDEAIATLPWKRSGAQNSEDADEEVRPSELPRLRIR
jgi:hypothetical protein